MLRRLVPQLLRQHAKQQQVALIATSPVVGDQLAPRSDQAVTRLNERTALGPFPSYTDDQHKQILTLVNSKSIPDLLSYEITKARVNKLHSWRSRNGPFQNIQDILLIEGFSLKVVKKFYDSLLHEPSSHIAQSKRSRAASFITPSIDADQQQAIRSCVSVRIGVSSVTWARLEIPPADVANAPCELTHWQHHDITERKLHLNDLVQRCLYFEHLIPAADCYLFENPHTAQPNNNPGNAEQQNINVQKAQITAVLSYALRARAYVHEQQHQQQQREDDAPKGDEVSSKAEKHRPNVFYLRRFLTARLFNNLIGAERVSSEHTIMNMMRTFYNTDEQEDFLAADSADEAHSTSPEARLSFSGNVQFPTDLRHMFARAERFHREFLGQVLLLNVSFVRLVLLQDPQSIAAVTRYSNTAKAAVTK